MVVVTHPSGVFHGWGSARIFSPSHRTWLLLFVLHGAGQRDGELVGVGYRVGLNLAGSVRYQRCALGGDQSRDRVGCYGVGRLDSHDSGSMRHLCQDRVKVTVKVQPEV